MKIIAWEGEEPVLGADNRPRRPLRSGRKLPAESQAEARLPAPDALLRAGAQEHGLVMNAGCVLIDRRRRLSSAVAVFAVELQRAHPVITVNALEDAAVLDARVGVMSHSGYCSLSSRGSCGTEVTNMSPATCSARASTH
jgi:hypothetical protein